MADQSALFEILPDGRSFLPPGTILDLSGNGGRYKITDKPVGYGGSGILYPAIAMTKQDGVWIDATLRVVVKECFPAGLPPAYGRVESGEIRNLAQAQESSEPLEGSGDRLLSLAKKMLLDEGRITGEIYTRGFRLTPVLHSAEEEIVILPGRDPVRVHNTVGILERLDEKGRPLSQILSLQVNGWQCFHLFGLIMRALAEVHDASYLHGDIQENNIFVKGWEPDARSCELTLVDFGSSRKLLEDGATEMIRDRLLFSTKGYAAPECFAGNDGTLRLTPAADLYSAGVLLLRMLNGRRPDRRLLPLIVGGRYLLHRRAKKMGIPSGTVPKINELLTGLLQQDPGQRYQSAAEVLEISDRIEQALAPQTSALEAIDYDAYISYCHEEPAAFIAKRIQQKLERYHIPKTVSRPDGKLTMGRVFLDWTELTAGTDLEEQFRSVLAHSAYLIVVLSPGVMNSPWVEREIRMFLETHGKDQILTVLAEGEPEDVTPSILREVEKEVDGVMKKTPVESLAADIRGSSNRERNKKLDTEIYRLLAPMLGCGYDDLVMRQKAYRQQQMLRVLTTAFLVTAAVLGVIIAQALTIRKNYRETLIRESVHLAQRSTEALAEGDRDSAVALALEALPDPDTNSKKPVTAQAKAALIRAMGYYQGADQRISALMPHSLLRMNYPGAEIEFTEEGQEQINNAETYLISADTHHSVYTWSIPDGKLLCVWNQEQILAACRDRNSSGGRSFDGSGRILRLAFERDDLVLIITDGAVLEGDPETGELRLRCTFPQVYISQQVLYLPKLNAFVVCRTQKEKESGDYTFVFELLDINTGESISELSVSDTLGKEASAFGSFDRILSAGDGSAAAIVLSNGIDFDRKSCLLIWQVEEDKIVRADIGDTGILRVDSVSENGMIVLTSNSPFMYLPAGEQQDAGLSLIDTQSGDCRWSTDIRCNLTGERAEAQAFSLNEKPYLMFWSGSQIFLLTMDGKLLFSGGAPGKICGAALTLDSHFLFCTQDGKLFRFYISGGMINDPFMQVEMSADAFTYHSDSGTAWMFDRTHGKTVVLRAEDDRRCQVLDMAGSSKFGITVADAHIAILATREEGMTEVSLYDRIAFEEAGTAGEEIPPQIISDEPAVQWTCKDFLYGIFCVEDSIYVYGESAEDGMTLTARSAQSGDLLWQRTLTGFDGENGALQISGDSKVLLCETGNGSSMLDAETGEEIISRTREDFAPENGILFGTSRDRRISFAADDRFLIVWEENDAVRVLDPKSEKVLSETEEHFDSVSEIQYDPDMQILTLQHPGVMRSAYYLTEDGQLSLIQREVPGNFTHGLFVSVDVQQLQLRLYPVRSVREMIREAK